MNFQGSDTHKVVDILSLASESNRSVGHDTFALSGSDGSAQVGLSRLAELAFPALCNTRVERDSSW